MKSDYYLNQESVDEYIELAKGVDSSSLIEILKSYLPEQASVLEIGSGPGTDFRILKEHYSVTGSDFSPVFIERLKKENPNDSFLLLNAITLATDFQFDAIYSNKVLQHLTDFELEKSIKHQKNVLRPKGLVCHSFWKGEGREQFKGMMVNYQNKQSLTTLFEPDFKVLHLEEYTEFENNDSLLLIAMVK